MSRIYLFRLWPYDVHGHQLQTSRQKCLGQCQPVTAGAYESNIPLPIYLSKVIYFMKCPIGTYTWGCACGIQTSSMSGFILGQLEGSQWNSHELA